MNFEKLKLPKIIILSLFLTIALMTSIASASITLTDHNQKIVLSNETISISELYNHIVNIKGESTTHDLYIQEVSPGIWQLKGYLTSDDKSRFIFNSEHGTELHISRTHAAGGTSFFATIDWRDVIIRQWNAETDEPTATGWRRWHLRSNSYIENVTFDTFNRIYIGDKNYGGSVTNITIKNTTMTDWNKDLRLRGSDFHIDGLNMIDSYHVWNSERAGVRNGVTQDSTFENIYVNPFKTFPKGAIDSTGSYGFQMSGTNNFYRNIHVENTTYSGFNLNGNYNQYENLSVHNSDHNQFEAHCNNGVYHNITITGGRAGTPGTQSGILVSRSSVQGTNLTMSDVYVDNYGSGGWIKMDGDIHPLTNYRFENVTSMRGSAFLYGVQDSVFKNITMHNSPVTAFSFGRSTTDQIPCDNISIIDSHNEEGKNYIYYNSKNIIMANADKNSFGYSHSGTSYYTSYPLNVKVINTKGVPVPDAFVSVFSDTNVIDSNGNHRNTAYTDSVGRLSGDDLFYITNFKRVMPSSYTYYTHTLSASKDGHEITLPEISPDSTWYREDPDNPTYTITAILPDEATKEPNVAGAAPSEDNQFADGPQITGFAPSEDNQFTAGESKTFRVWSDETLTSMEWYVDGKLMSSGSMEYEWDIETGSHSIMFSGSNANGAVLQTWVINEGTEVPDEIPGTAGADISFTPIASSLTSSVGESTTFAVDSGQDFTSALWYIDGKLVESDAVTHVQDWDTAGTHTVRFDGVAAAGTITRTWTAVVSGAQTAGGNIISISPSTTVVAPGEAFTLDVYIDPVQDLTGSQFDLHYSQLATVSSVTEGNLFSLTGRSTTFENDGIDNSAGILKRVYSAIVSSGTTSKPGTMATVNMLAGSSTGILDIELAGVVLSDVNSNPAGYAASGTTVLIDTAPEFTSLPARYVEEGESLSFTVSATDADGDELSYSATSLPSGASFNAKTATLSWTPSAGDAGSYEAVFEVTDGYLQDSMIVEINVIEPNNAPVISLFEPADNAVFEEGSTVNVNVLASDEDGQSLSYVIKIDGSQVSTTSSYTWNLDYGSAGTHSIEVIVSDGIDEVSASRTISITELHPRWDVNEDGIVNILDITLVCQNYGATYTGDLPRWDVNQDGVVNIQDLSIISGRFGEIV